MKEKHTKNSDSKNLFKALGELTKTVNGLARDLGELTKTVNGLARDLGELTKTVTSLANDQKEPTKTVDVLAMSTAKRFDAHDSAFQTMMREIRLIREDTRDIKMSMSPLNNTVASHDREIRDLHARVLHLERKTISGK